MDTAGVKCFKCCFNRLEFLLLCYSHLSLLLPPIPFPCREQWAVITKLLFSDSVRVTKLHSSPTSFPLCLSCSLSLSSTLSLSLFVLFHLLSHVVLFPARLHYLSWSRLTVSCLYEWRAVREREEEDRGSLGDRGEGEGGERRGWEVWNMKWIWLMRCWWNDETTGFRNESTAHFAVAQASFLFIHSVFTCVVSV